MRACLAGMFGSAVPAIVAMLTLSCGYAAAQQTPPNTNFSTRPAEAEVEQRIQSLAIRKATEQWRFDIGSTGVLPFSAEELTGGEKGGLPSRALLSTRRSFALRSLALYTSAKRRLGIKPTGLGGVTCRPGAKSFNAYYQGYVYPPRNQNVEHGASCGSCWAFAATAAYESSYLIENGVRADVTPPVVTASEQRLLNCTPDSSCELGYVYKALDTLVLQGTISRGDVGGNYLASKVACLLTNNIRFRAVAWGPLILDSTRVASPRRIKEALCTFGPVTSRIIVTDSFKALVGATPFHQVDPIAVTVQGAHHLVIVGWDDSKGEKGAWLVKNSWGETWGMVNEGMPGYAWVEYGANLIGHHANWVLAFHEKVPIGAMEPKYSRLKSKYLLTSQ
jgi:Papain family cysteine protease